MKKYFTKEQLIYILLTVSIITVAIIGLTQFRSLASQLLSNISSAATSVIVPFSLAFFLSFIIAPLARFIERKTKLNQTLSIITAITIGSLLIVSILSLTISFIVIQLSAILTSLIDMIDHDTVEAVIESVLAFTNQLVDPDVISDMIANFNFSELNLSEISGFFSSFILGVFSVSHSVISVIFTIILTPVFMYYLIKDRELIFTSIANVFPQSISKHLNKLGPETDKVIRGYFLGHGLVMLFITAFFIITYTILSFFIPNFSVAYAILFALVMGMFSIIPYLGVWISMSMPVVLFLTLHLDQDNGSLIYIIGIIMIFVLNIIEEILESSLVQPNVFSKQVHIHPLAVLSSFIFFGGVFGLAGFILAVPIAGMIKVTFKYFKKLNKEKGTSKS